MPVRRVPITFNRVLGWLGTLFGTGPSRSWIDIYDATVSVRMGWAFGATIDRAANTAAGSWSGRVWGWGAHGWRRHWLVNGTSKGIVTIELDPLQPGRVLGFPLRLRQLSVSVADPDALLAELAPPAAVR